jgi:hypothetical protein
MDNEKALQLLMECFKNKKKKTNSSISLIKVWLNNPDLPQSELIAFGKKYEKWLSCLASENYEALTQERDLYITPKGEFTTKRKGNKDIDNLFIDHKKKIVYYNEVKCNLTLDSEKKIATADKVRYIERHLNNHYPEYKVVASIVNMAWVGNKKEMHGVPIIYMKDYFSLVKSDIKTEDEYNEMGAKLGKVYGR